MQQLDKSPTKVNINIEQPVGLTYTAFESILFIAENNLLEDKEYKFEKLGEVIEAGFGYGSSTYNFCRSAFKVGRKCVVYVRLKRRDESYEDCYDKRDNSNFYYVVIESKNFRDIYNFNQHISKDTKLHFFSTYEDVGHLIGGMKVVYYWQPTYNDFLLLDNKDFVALDSERYIRLQGSGELFRDVDSFWMFDGGQGDIETYRYLADEDENVLWDFNEFLAYQQPTVDNDNYVAWDEDGAIPLDNIDYTTPQEANNIPNFYPEAAWIARCIGFPTRTQWLYKTLEGVEGFDVDNIPLNSNTSTYVRNSKVTLGTGCTAQGVRIEQQVFLDWLKWAIQHNMWNLLYTSEKVPATRGGLSLFEHRLKEPLDYSLDQQAISDYSITESKIYDQDKVSFKFKITLMHSILGVDAVEGTVEH